MIEDRALAVNRALSLRPISAQVPMASSMRAESSRYVNRISASSHRAARTRLASIQSRARAAARRRRAPAPPGIATSDAVSPRRRRIRRIGADRRRRLDAVRAAQPLQAQHLLARRSGSRAQQPRDEADLGEVLDRLHLVVGGEQIGADRQRAVVGEQHAVVRLDVLADGRRAAPSSKASRTRQSECCRASSAPRRAPRDRAGCRPPRTRSRSADARARRRCTSGRCRYTSRCISISDDGSRSPWSFRPSRSVMHIMSGVMNPLQTLFGVISRRSGAEADADVAVVAGGVAAGVHAPADFDDVGAKRRIRRLMRSRARYCVAALVRAEVDAGSAVGERHARDLDDEGAADRITHHLHASRPARRALGARGARRTPRGRPQPARQNARATKSSKQERAGDSGRIRHPASAACRRGRMRRLAGCRARAWRPGPPGCRARAG